MAGGYGILNDQEITEAVKRQKAYKQLSREWRQAEGRLSWLKTRRLRKLSCLPRIHIDDFNTMPSSVGGELGANSYDLRLSPNLLVYDVPVIRAEHRDTVALPNGVGLDWSPYVLDARKNTPTRSVRIPDDGYVLKPGRLYLGSTIEHTETYNLVPQIDGRSSTGRLGLFLHVTAGRGDVGYQGRWTLEMAVIHPVRIYPDMKLAQITYSTVRPGGSQYRGRYQNAADAQASRMYLG